MGSFSRACFISMFLVSCGGDPGANGDDGPGTDGGDNLVCTEDSTCDGTQPYCVGGNCVECRDGNDCPEDRPVCGNNQCVASCAGDEVMADFVTVPSDIIWVVDQSGSMNQETQYVQSKINDFAASISASNIDYHVVMIASTSASNDICVPAPLSNGSCGNNTNFRLVNHSISSHDALTKFVTYYPEFDDFLRPEAMKHIIIVTDDNASNPSTAAATFKTALANVTPAGMFDNYKVHAIYAYGNGQSSGCSGPFGTGAQEGTVYTTLVTDTGGARGVICEDDWTTVFNDITAAVVSGSQIACELAVPTPTNGETLDPTKVNVKYQSGAAPGTTLPQVTDAAACGAAGGWYYDDNVAPTKITLCPATCTQVQGDDDANVKIELGCSTQIL
jgi:hypothetical protein